jgi:hypothetical protein
MVCHVNHTLQKFLLKIALDFNASKASGSGLFENFSETVKEIFLNRIDDIVRRYIPDEKNEKYRLGYKRVTGIILLSYWACI